MLERKVQKKIDRNSLQNKKFLLAVSGGADSMAMLHVFARLVSSNKLFVLTVDHGLRPSSASEASYVAETARSIGLNARVVKVAPASKSEASARHARYEALRRCKEELGFDYLVTGHHLNDQLETFLMKISRGSGLLSVWGMKELSGDLFRPMLDIPKSEITKYCYSNNIAYVKDETNSDTKYKRNYYRQVVIPALSSREPGLLSLVNEIIKMGQSLADHFEQRIRKQYERVMQDDALVLKRLQELSSFELDGVLFRFLKNSVPGDKEVTTEHLEELKRLLSSSGNRFFECGGIVIRKEYGLLSVAPPVMDKKLESRKLSFGKVVKFGDFRLKLQKKICKANKNNILIPEDLSYNLSVRTWQPGDRIKTESGTKKLQNIFTDAKIPNQKRKTWPVVIADSIVIWVPGHSASWLAIKEHKKKGAVIEYKNETTKK